jgi:aerotaxis receptor
MRNNQPVTGREYLLSPDDSLVSVTDLKGRITYVNPAFIQASGYTREELLGQPHNLIRHPDMPAEAFRDLWATLQAGQPWSALVKNRRKNGDHYWVLANATPMFDGERIVGYLSVRTTPARDAVQTAEALYARMREEASRGRLTHTLSQGKVLKGSSGRFKNWLRSGSMMLLGAEMLTVLWGALWALFAPLWTLIPALLFGGWLSHTLIRKVSYRPLEQLTEEANRLSGGDLGHAIATGAAGTAGRMQQALSQLRVNLRAVVRDVRQEVESLELAVREINQGNHDLSARTEAQAGSLEETAASIVQIRGTVLNSAASAKRGAGLADETASVTRRSNEAVEAVGESMTGIADSARRIGDIINLIESIAFQTNILALNAAVEAARAGEQGRGFAVVASEVRALAQKTTAAAGEVKGVIAESSKWVDAGTKTTGQARQRMTEALASVDKMNALLNEISIATSEQQDGIEEINQAMVQLDGLTQQNAAMVEELAAAASSAEGQMEGVSNSMRLFRLTGGEVSLAQVDAVALRREARDIPALPDQAVQAGHVAQAVQAARMAASAPRLPGA